MIQVALALLLAPAGLPTLPAGLRPEFHKLAGQIQFLLSAKQWDGAAKLAQAMPTRSVKVQVDLSAVAPERRPEYASDVQAAMDSWAKAANATFTKVAKDAHIVIRFAPTAKLGQAAKLELSEAPTRASLTIGLERGNPPRPAVGPSVNQEVLHAIGAYFGVADSKGFGTAMGRNDLQQARVNGVSPWETTLSRAALHYSASVREAIAKTQPVAVAAAAYEIENPIVAGGQVLQGDMIEAILPVKNNGTSPLQIVARPDCSCIYPTYPEEIAPGQTGELKIRVDTTEYTGEFRHKVLVWTNDPKSLYQEIPIEIDIDPILSITHPKGNSVLVEDGQTEAEVEYLFAVYGEDPPIPISGSLEGFEGKVVIEKLSTIPPGFVKPPTQAFRIRAVLQAADVRPGRSSGNISLILTDDRFSPFRRPLYAQKGIAVSPTRVSFGEMKGARDGQVLLGRTGKPFRILKATVDSPHLSLKIEPGPEGWDFRIWVAYDGKAGAGEFYSIVTLETDVKGQEVIRIPVTGHLPGAR